MEDLFTNVLNETFQESGNSADSAKKFFDTISNKIMKSGYEAQTFMFLFHVARTFRIHQYSLFLNNACASGLYSIEAASDMIRLEKAPVVIVAASDHANIYKHLWFKSINMYASDGKIKPYAEGNNGLVMGEGATALILEDYDHATKRGAHIYAEYLGGGFRLEGWKVTIPQLGGASYSDAIEDALTASGLDRDEIDLVCGHAPGTTASDNYEAQAIMNVFSGRDVPVTAFKPYVGHVLGASTLVETAILLLAMKNGFVPPVMNTARIDSRIKVNVIQEGRKENLTTTMKLCCAFAGYNAASVFRKIS
jgi:3-oxoacyl-[acyl-carrier-protein] synthase II